MNSVLCQNLPLVGNINLWKKHFWHRFPKETKRVAVDTGFVDTDSKWRQAVGEITADYQDVLFKKGFGGIKKEAEAYLAELDATSLEGAEKIEFYRSIGY